ncbi:hypothetical protein [Duganella callida]|uniref:Uncharacterized protein n=1 Tax=Duganella callida TaxID=2561932 RepID=A0A4Y9RXX4_9BURK|nr:hypothetical protein [Duganella callida]TFW13914.1 hypothetical protein E4L98_27915 [Duganella callida]
MDTSTPRPDLLAGTTRAAPARRILAQLEHGARPQLAPVKASSWTIDGWTVGLCVLLLVMCTTAWLVHSKKLTPAGLRSGASYSGSTVTHHPRPPSVTASSVTPPPSLAEDDEQAATIVNADSAGDKTAASPMTGSHQAAATGAGARGGGIPANRPTFAADTIGHLPGAARAPASSAVAQTGAAHPATVGATGRAAATPRKADAGSSAAAANNADTDITLLTALVAHSNKPAAVTPERPRDVVERQDGDSTAQLLVRCKQLGLIEGMLCRSRICSGRWESDPACSAPSH